MDSKSLKKYLDPSFSLLDKFRELAPGSFKHCQNVSSICEPIAVELNLDIDIMKLSALYHDIGKMNNPTYFSENQGDDNIHDNLDPFVSYHTITRHVGDSVLYLLQCENMPQQVIEIVSQHHGDTILKSFYSKAKKGTPEDIYRYKCIKPTSTEAAILMIVDSVEATSRSMANSDAGDFISVSITKTIDRLVDDGQLDRMTLGTLKIVKNILFKELESIYHKRVPYKPDEDDEKPIGDITS